MLNVILFWFSSCTNRRLAFNHFCILNVVSYLIMSNLIFVSYLNIAHIKFCSFKCLFVFKYCFANHRPVCFILFLLLSHLGFVFYFIYFLILLGSRPIKPKVWPKSRPTFTALAQQQPSSPVASLGPIALLSLQASQKACTIRDQQTAQLQGFLLRPSDRSLHTPMHNTSPAFPTCTSPQPTSSTWSSNLQLAPAS